LAHRVRRAFVNIPPLSALNLRLSELLCIVHKDKLLKGLGGGLQWAITIGFF